MGGGEVWLHANLYCRKIATRFREVIGNSDAFGTFINSQFDGGGEAVLTSQHTGKEGDPKI